MNDAPGSRRPASRSPRRRGPASTQLGELRFSDWYETPVFEPDDDELIEEMATAGRGPRRFMARARLAREARRANRLPKWDAQPPPPPSAKPEPVVRAAEPEPIVSAKPKPEPAVAAKPESPVAAKPKPEPVVRAAEPEPIVSAKPKPEPPVAAKPKPEPAVATKPKPQPKPVAATKPEPVAATKTAPAAPEVDNWMTSGPALTDESMRLDLERDNAWHRRVESFLDRWAEREVAVAGRLDRSLERVLNLGMPAFLASAAKRVSGSR